MRALSPVLTSTIAARHGIVTTSELMLDGISSTQIRRHVTAGALIHCHDGVYRIATSPDSFVARCVAACLADVSAVISGVAAGSLWRFRHVHRPKRPIVLVGHNRTPLTRGVTLRRTNVLDDEDRVERNDGICVAAPPRTWFDCARDVGDDTFEAITEWVLDHHTTMPTLWRTFRRLQARGRPGLARVRRVMSRRADWQRPAGSKLELRVLTALRRRGVPELVRQHRLALPDGVVIHADGADPSVRWAIEVDHVTWHGGRLDAQRDKGRDRGLRRIGWTVERVTDQELRDDFDRTMDEIAALYFLRARSIVA